MSDPPDPGVIAGCLLSWFPRAARDLPWRRRRDPYAVWVSEVMLQQTQVATVIPYFERWMALFPDIQALAAAPLFDVLKAWEGLGYYARARNLHRAARQLVAQHDGQLPAVREQLLRVPGIGRYTVGAILSLAYGQREPVLDGNVRRVLCRIYDISEDPREPKARNRLWELAARLVEAAPEGRAGQLNEALMELGALICVPGQPGCADCPLATCLADDQHELPPRAPTDLARDRALCLAHQRGVEAQRPIRLPRPQPPHYDVAAAIIRDQGRYLIVQRPPSGLLGGLWGFPATVAGECDAGQQDKQGLAECLAKALEAHLGLQVTVGPSLPPIKHAYTHLRITLHPFHCQLRAGGRQAAASREPLEESESQPGQPTGRPSAMPYVQARWVAVDLLPSYPFAVTDRKVLQLLGPGQVG